MLTGGAPPHVPPSQIRLWDLRAGNATAIIRAFETQATSVSYGKDFTVLANSRDNVIKVG